MKKNEFLLLFSWNISTLSLENCIFLDVGWTQSWRCEIETLLFSSESDVLGNSFPDNSRASDCLAACQATNKECCRINYDWTPARCHTGKIDILQGPILANHWAHSLRGNWKWRQENWLFGIRLSQYNSNSFWFCFFVVLESNSPYTCYPGAGQSGTSIATLDVCGKKECKKNCDNEILCQGFDYVTTGAKCSCRLFPENKPRKGDGGTHLRQYCKKKILERGKVH